MDLGLTYQDDCPQCSGQLEWAGQSGHEEGSSGRESVRKKWKGKRQEAKAVAIAAAERWKHQAIAAAEAEAAAQRAAAELEWRR